jgi:hypothetical protein
VTSTVPFASAASTCADVSKNLRSHTNPTNLIARVREESGRCTSQGRSTGAALEGPCASGS